MSEPPPREANTDADAGADRASVPVRERADGYFRNGAWVPRDAEPDPRPPGWREWFESRISMVRGVDRRIRYAAGGLAVVLVVLLVVIAHRGSPTRTPAPAAERHFLDAVERGQTAVRNGNDITLVTAARARSTQACAKIPRDGAVHNWFGTLTKVGTVFGGNQGEVAVSLGDGVKLRTWNHKSEDTEDHTLVDSHSDVYQQLAGLKNGQMVLFSGNFVARGPVCLQETSVFPRNGMLTPSFVFRFTSVTARHP